MGTGRFTRLILGVFGILRGKSVSLNAAKELYKGTKNKETTTVPKMSIN